MSTHPPAGTYVYVCGPAPFMQAVAPEAGCLAVHRESFGEPITGADGDAPFTLALRRSGRYSFLFVRPDSQQLAGIGGHLAASRLRPVVDKIFPFTQAGEALAYLEQGRAKGKVVVELVASGVDQVEC